MSSQSVKREARPRAPGRFQLVASAQEVALPVSWQCADHLEVIHLCTHCVTGRCTSFAHFNISALRGENNGKRALHELSRDVMCRRGLQTPGMALATAIGTCKPSRSAPHECTYCIVLHAVADDEFLEGSISYHLLRQGTARQVLAAAESNETAPLATV